MNQNQEENSSDDVIQFEDNEIIDFNNIESNHSPKDCQPQKQELKNADESINCSQLMLIQVKIDNIAVTTTSKITINVINIEIPINNNKNKKNDCPELQKFKDNNYTILQNLQIDFSLEQFLTSPAPKGGMIQCRFYRASPKFTLFWNNTIIFYQMQRRNPFKQRAAIKFLQKEKEEYLGKIKGDFKGLKYLIYDNGKTAKKSKDINQLRKELGVVYYQSYEKKLRSIQSFIPQITPNGQMYEFKCQKPYTSIVNSLDNVIELVNRKPQWIPSYKAYGLNFYGRIFTSSVKNFILTERGSEIPVLLFGKNDDREFVLDFSYPLTPVQAFCIALSSTDHKIGCK